MLRSPLLALVLAPLIARPQPGALDPSFGDGGIVLTPFATGNAICSKVLVAPDGGYYAAGYFANGIHGTDFALVKYNADGTLDTGFGTNGIATQAVGTSNDNCYAAALQSDGKILLGGDFDSGSTYDLAVVRFLADGTPDPGFGTNGVATVAVGGADNYGTDIAVQPDGKVLLMGRHLDGDWDFIVLRLNADGSPDTGFGTNGIRVQSVGAGDDNGYAMALQPDGRIILIGDTRQPGGEWNVALVRLTADGMPDDTFSGDGIAVHDPGTGDSYAYAGLLQPDGKIVAAGGAYGGDMDRMIVRFLPDGSLDPGFGTNGVTLSDFGGVESGNAVARGADGDLVVSGSGLSVGFDVAHYTADGQLDPGFGTGGHAVTAIGSTIFNTNTSVLIDGSGRIVVAGHARDPNTADQDFALIRYMPAGPAGIREAAVDDLHLILAPDPVTPASALCFTLMRPARVSLAVLDAAGRTVAIPAPARAYAAGTHTEGLDVLNGLAAGRYTLLLSAGEQRASLPFVKVD